MPYTQKAHTWLVAEVKRTMGVSRVDQSDTGLKTSTELNDGHGRGRSPSSQFTNQSSVGGGHGVCCLYSTASQLQLNGGEKQLCMRMRQFIEHLMDKVLGTSSSSSGTTNCRREEAREEMLRSARNSRTGVAAGSRLGPGRARYRASPVRLGLARASSLG